MSIPQPTKKPYRITKRDLILTVVCLLGAILFRAAFEPGSVFCGSEKWRQAWLRIWIEDKTPLGILHIISLSHVLSTTSADMESVELALRVVRTHLPDNEENFIPYITYWALAGRDLNVSCEALDALRELSSRNRAVAIAVFNHHLRHSQGIKQWPELTSSVLGLYRLRVNEALPDLQRLMFAKSGLVSWYAKRAVLKLQFEEPTIKAGRSWPAVSPENIHIEGDLAVFLSGVCPSRLFAVRASLPPIELTEEVIRARGVRKWEKGIPEEESQVEYEFSDIQRTDDGICVLLKGKNRPEVELCLALAWSVVSELAVSEFKPPESAHTIVK